MPFSVSGYVFFFKQKTAYEMRISDWSSDVCSSDLICKQVMDVFANAILPRAQCLVGYFLRDREEALIIAYGMAPYHSNDLPGGGHRRISCSSPRLVRP